MTFDFTNVDKILKTKPNPEICHYQNNSHPGVNWWLKTVIPNHPSNCYALDIVKFWNRLAKLYPTQILISDIAFDWNNNRIDYCQSIWLNKKIDIKVKIDEDGDFDYDILDYDEGLYISAKELLLLNDLPIELLDAVEFLIRLTPENKSKILRSKIKVLDDIQLEANK
jgi:hypothetical protein